MKLSQFKACLIITIALVFASVGFTARANPRGRQAASEASLANALKRNVALNLGETTLAKVTAELSRQSRVSVTAASSLRERQLIVWMPEATLRQTLDALAELYDWVWYKTDTGFAIARRSARKPFLLRETTAALQRAFPVDFRTYLKLASNTPWSDTGAERHASEARMKMNKAIQPLLSPEKPLLYSQIDSKSREYLAFYLFMTDIEFMGDILTDGFHFHRMDWRKSCLSLREGRVLEFGFYDGDKHLMTIGQNLTTPPQ